MNTHYLILDFVDFLVDSPNTNAERYNLTVEVLKENGPAGGNPEIRLSGSYDNLTKYVWNEYCPDDDEDAEFFCELIQER